MNRLWTVERHLDGVNALHSLGIPELPTRLARLCVPERSAIVLGSAQPATDVDGERLAQLDVDVVRRRSGGGAVLVEPDDVVWVDIVVPADDELWHADVGRAFWWLGDVWARTLAEVGFGNTEVHKGGLITTAWSRKVCFAGLGPGEVVVDGRKLVGISQRRTRSAALFQCALLRRFDIDKLLGLLVLDAGERAEARGDIAESVTVAADLDVSALEQAFLAELANVTGGF